MSDTLKAALWYAEKKGYSVVPFGMDKRPCIPKWQEWQNKRADRAQILAWWNKYPEANVGMVTGKISGLAVIDIDKPEGEEELNKLISESAIIPTCTTPRGGKHLYFTYPTDIDLRNQVNFLPGVDLRAEGGVIKAPPSTDGQGGFYQWIKGSGIQDVSTIDLPTNVINIILKILRGDYKGGNVSVCEVSKNSDLTKPYITYNILQEGTRDNDLWKIGMALADGHCPIWMMEQVLEKLALSAIPPYPLNEVSVKIKSILGRLERKERNLAEEVREFFYLQKGYTELTSILHHLQILTKPEKNNLFVILNRLEKEGVIEKYGEKRGVYRPVEKEENLMEFVEEEIFEYPVRLPLGLNDLCKIYPQNIIVIAGSKSAGKTALLMEIAKLNQNTATVVYLNSEMGRDEWSERLKAMGIKRKNDIKFKGIECHNNFHDKIDGSKTIYLVDYLEIHDNFYEIAKPIRQIHEKLRDGICIIGVQKKFGELLARGAEFSMEKSRLYLSLDYVEEDGGCTKMTIIDAKTPKLSNGIRGYFKRLKIRNGAIESVLDANWKYEALTWSKPKRS